MPRRSILTLAAAVLLATLAGLGGLARRPPDAPAPAAERSQRPVAQPAPADAGAIPVDRAVRARADAAWVDGEGRVLRLLRDDRTGSAHQRFVLRLDDGATVLVAHNIDLAARLDGLAAGDRVAFRGEYVWTPQGGTVHWTHADPRGRRAGGWLHWRGRTYR